MSIYLSKESCATIHWFNIYGSITITIAGAERKLSKTYMVSISEELSLMRRNEQQQQQKQKSSLKLWLILSRNQRRSGDVLNDLGKVTWDRFTYKSPSEDASFNLRPKAERGVGFERVSSYTEL